MILALISLVALPLDVEFADLMSPDVPASGEEGRSLKFGPFDEPRPGEDALLFFPFPLPFGALESGSCAIGQSDALGQEPFDLQCRRALFLLFARPPRESPTALPEAIKTLLPDMFRRRTSRVSTLSFLLDMFPHRRNQELIAPAGVVRVEATIVRNLVTDPL